MQNVYIKCSKCSSLLRVKVSYDRQKHTILQVDECSVCLRKMELRIAELEQEVRLLESQVQSLE